MQNELLDPEIAAQGFAAAGSASRLLVLRALVRAGPRGLPVSEIQQRLGIPASTLAHHLRFLAAAGLIVQERRGRQLLSRANYERISALADFLLHACCADDQSCAGAEDAACSG
jgi:ArsR family transcriptional regulator, arsenate/arsenite/antimonite-responsive transcriptional repressor